ncbi:MAG: DUF72 domain-containing protein [Bacteroidota bacterium]
MKIHIGCSGWNYKDWRGKFYPEELAQKKWLEHYASLFNTVEVNNTFYKLPKESTLKKWEDQVPADFNFTLKGSRYVTQMKKLKDPEDSLKKFEAVAAVMKKKLSCILWQLPPNLHRNDEKLINFCKAVKPENGNVIEFRHDSWFNREVYDILEEYKVHFCSISSPELPDDMIVTGGLGYVRFHGKGKDWYNYHYSKEELQEWHKKIKNSEAKEVFIYFNNDIDGNAPKNAMELKEIFGLD